MRSFETKREFSCERPQQVANDDGGAAPQLGTEWPPSYLGPGTLTRAGLGESFGVLCDAFWNHTQLQCLLGVLDHKLHSLNVRLRTARDNTFHQSIPMD